MSRQHLTRIKCDHCDKWINVADDGSSSRASQLAEKKGWVVQRTDFYGNEVDFCSGHCQLQFWEKLQVVPEVFED